MQERMKMLYAAFFAAAAVLFVRPILATAQGATGSSSAPAGTAVPSGTGTGWLWILLAIVAIAVAWWAMRTRRGGAAHHR